MINKGNIDNLKIELTKNKNNATAFVFDKVKVKEGPLEGVAVTIKDVYAMADSPVQASSKLLEGFKPGYDATVITKLRHAGAGIVGKVHSDELALGGTGAFSGYGRINNPIDETRMPGGSSSGSVATFTRNVGVAIGSDTGDSVRSPASFNGIVGFKPTYGAISRYGQFAFATSLDTVAYFTHNVADTITIANVLYGIDHKDMTTVQVEVPTQKSVQPMKVAVLDTMKMITKTAQTAIDNLSLKLVSKGTSVDIVRVDRELLDQIEIVYEVISFAEVSSNDSNLSGFLFGNRGRGSSYTEIATETRAAGLGAMVQRRFALGAFYLLKENQEEIFIKAKKVRKIMQDKMQKIFKEYDVLIFPSQRIAPSWTKGKVGDWYSNILTMANLVGNPSISIPWIKEGEMPIGLQVESGLKQDKKLLSHTLWIEELIGGKHEK